MQFARMSSHPWGRVVTGRVCVVVVVVMVRLLLLAAEVGERPADYGRVAEQAQVTAAAAVSAAGRGTPSCKRARKEGLNFPQNTHSDKLLGMINWISLKAIRLDDTASFEDSTLPVLFLIMAAAAAAATWSWSVDCCWWCCEANPGRTG